MPHQAHLAVGVAGDELAAELGVGCFAEAFVGREQHRTCSTNGPPGASSTPRTSTSPRPTITHRYA